MKNVIAKLVLKDVDTNPLFYLDSARLIRNPLSSFKRGCGDFLEETAIAKLLYNVIFSFVLANISFENQADFSLALSARSILIPFRL